MRIYDYLFDERQSATTLEEGNVEVVGRRNFLKKMFSLIVMSLSGLPLLLEPRATVSVPSNKNSFDAGTEYFVQERISSRVAYPATRPIKGGWIISREARYYRILGRRTKSRSCPR